MGSDATKAAHERSVLAIVERLEKNTTSFLQEEHSSDSPIRQEADIGNVDVPIHFASTTGDFQASIDELKSQSLTISHQLETQMIEQAKAEIEQV